jgi:hypothetical protein
MLAIDGNASSPSGATWERTTLPGGVAAVRVRNDLARSQAR